MAVEIITGHTGKEHVTAEAAGALHAGVIGTGKYVLAGGNQFAAEIVSNNLIKIKSGELVNQGRHMRIPVNSYEEVTIQNGAQGMHRSDLIVMRYKKRYKFTGRIGGTCGDQGESQFIHSGECSELCQRKHSVRSNAG